MRIRLLALVLVWSASLCGQRRFSWQNYCFDHPAAPFCSGHEYAIKPPPRTKGAAPPNVSANPAPSTPRIVTPSVIVVGGIDWRFADPVADALVGFNFSRLSASPLARNLIAQLGASQGLTESDIQKIFDGMSGVDQVALSVRDNRVVVMVIGGVTDSNRPAPDTGFKAVPVSGNAMLFGHADAVDQAVQRMAMKSPPEELSHLVAEWPANTQFWAVGSAGLVGPEAVSAGVKRFSLTIAVGNRLTTDLALEFDGATSASTLGMWQTRLAGATIEGNAIHVRKSIEADEMQQKSGEIAASPLGQRLAALVTAGRYLRVHDTTVPRHAKPVIYGLDGGPKEVNQD
jgi:hypothetical protein